MLFITSDGIIFNPSPVSGFSLIHSNNALHKISLPEKKFLWKNFLEYSCKVEPIEFLLNEMYNTTKIDKNTKYPMRVVIS